VNPYKRPESVLVVVHARGQALLLKRADLPEFWQSVTGAMRWDETDPRVTAVRELEEETGMRVTLGALRDLGLTARFPILPQFRHRYAPGVVENVEHAFALELQSEVVPRLSSVEHTAFGWYPMAQAASRVASWTNRDALRVLARGARETVVLVHGWWMNGWWMLPLAARLRRAGFDVRTFSYASVRADLRDSAQRLHRFLETLPNDVVHLVGHSLGGMVIRALFHYCPPRQAGRVVTLGTPHHGSVVGARLARTRAGRRLLGRSVVDVVRQVASEWPAPPRDLGVVSGTRSFGIGRCISALPERNDGTLTLSETSFAAARAQLVAPVTHTGMLTSRRVAEAVAHFLRTGAFDAA
jgi:pimeloyl-ACP methyl ester carboxylesterase